MRIEFKSVKPERPRVRLQSVPPERTRVRLTSVTLNQAAENKFLLLHLKPKSTSRLSLYLEQENKKFKESRFRAQVEIQQRVPARLPRGWFAPAALAQRIAEIRAQANAKAEAKPKALPRAKVVPFPAQLRLQEAEIQSLHEEWDRTFSINNRDVL